MEKLICHLKHYKVIKKNGFFSVYNIESEELIKTFSNSKDAKELMRLLDNAYQKGFESK